MIFVCLTKYILHFPEILFINKPQTSSINCKEHNWEFCVLHYGLYNVSIFVCIVDICEDLLYLTGDYTGPILTEYYIPPTRVYQCHTVSSDGWVQYWVTSCEIRGGRSDTREDFPPSLFGFPY